MFCCYSIIQFAFSFFLFSFLLFQLLDKPWSQVSSLFPTSKCLRFYRAESSASPTLVDIHQILATHVLELSERINFHARKSPYDHEHALGETRSHKSTLVGTRFTYHTVTPSGTPLYLSSSYPTVLPCLGCCAEGSLRRARYATAAMCSCSAVSAAAAMRSPSRRSA